MYIYILNIYLKIYSLYIDSLCMASILCTFSSRCYFLFIIFILVVIFLFFQCTLLHFHSFVVSLEHLEYYP